MLKPSPLKHKEIEGEALHSTLVKKEHDEKHGTEESMEETVKEPVEEVVENEKKVKHARKYKIARKGDDEYKEYKGSRRNIDGDKGVYLMYNPKIGAWKPITQTNFRQSVKKSKYNEEAGYYERDWGTEEERKKALELEKQTKKKPFDFNGTKDFSTNAPQFGVDAEKEVPKKKPFDFNKTIDFNKPKAKTLVELQKAEKDAGKKEETSIVKNLNEEDKEVVEEVIEEKKPEVVQEEKVDDSWKNEYENVTGKNADENNVTKEEARKLLDKTAIGKNVKQTPLVKKILETPTHVLQEDSEEPVNVNDLGSKDLATHRDRIHQDEMENYHKSPEFITINSEIETAISPYATTVMDEMVDAYDLHNATPTSIFQAEQEFRKKLDEKYTKALGNNKAYQKQTKEITSTVNSMFGNRIQYLSKSEKLDEANLPEFAREDKGFFGSAYRQAMISFPKAANDFAALKGGVKIEKLSSELSTIKKQNPEDEIWYPGMYSADKDLRIKPGTYKIADLIPQMEAIKTTHKQKFWTHMVKSQEYQDLLQSLPPQASFFDEDGNFDMVDFEEFRGIAGTQSIQMLAGALGGLAPTLWQEAGGAFEEILDKKAAEKATNMGLDYNNIPAPIKAAIWMDIIEKGEGDLNLAMSTGATNTLLEVVEAMIVLPKVLGVKPSNFLPKNFVAKIVERTVKKNLKSTAKRGGSMLTISAQSGIIEASQEISTMAHVGGTDGNYDWSSQRAIDAGLTAFLLPVPMMGANVTIQKVVTESIAQVEMLSGKPNATRVWINKAKAEAAKKKDSGDITPDKYLEIIDSLDAIEIQANNNKVFNGLPADAKKLVIDNLVKKKQLERQNKKTQKQIDDSKKNRTLDIPFQYDPNVAREIEIQNKQKEIIKLDQDNNIESLVAHVKVSSRGIAKFVNENQSDPNFAGKKMKIFTTVKELRNEMKDPVLFKANYGLDLTNPSVLEKIESIMAPGMNNGLNFGDIAIGVEEVIEENIRVKKDWTSANTTYHEGLHFILDNLPVETLEGLQDQMIIEFMASPDPTIRSTAMLVGQRMEQYDKSIDKKVKNKELTEEEGKRQKVEEFFTATSDALQYLNATDLTTETGGAFATIATYLGNTLNEKIGRIPGIDYSALNAGNALDFIQSYNQFNGTGRYYGPKMKGGKKNDDEDKSVVAKASESVIVDKINDIYENKGILGYEDIMSVLQGGGKDGSNYVDGVYKGPGQARDIVYRNLIRFARRPNYSIQQQDLYNDIMTIPTYGIETAIMRFKPNTIGADGLPVTMAKHIFGWLKVKPIDIANKTIGKVKDTPFTREMEGWMDDVIADESIDPDAETQIERQTREDQEIQPRLIDNLPIDKKVTVDGKTDTYENFIISNLKIALAEKLPEANISKNKKTSDFVSSIKKYTGDRITGTQFATINMMGRKGLDLNNFLLDNHSWILKGMTTTWLARNFPNAVEKSVGGTKVYGINPDTGKREVIGFTPNFVKHKDWKGKKIDREIASVHGTTSGPAITRRNPNGIAAITPEEFAGMYVKKTDKKGEIIYTPIQSKVEGLATQIAGEVSLEILNKDFSEKGELYDVLDRMKTFRGEVMSENIATEISKDIERGGVKMSETVSGLPDDEKATFYDLLPRLGEMLAFHQNNVAAAFRKTYKDPELFGIKRDKIIKDLERYVATYLDEKKNYDLIGAKIPKEVADYISDETSMRDHEKTIKKLLKLKAGSIDFRNEDQLKSMEDAVLKIAQKIGIDKTVRFLRPTLTASGKRGGTKNIRIEEGPYGVVEDAEFDQKLIDKPGSKRKSYKEIETLRYGLYNGVDWFDQFITSALPGWKRDYKTSIEKNAAQNVNVDVSTPALAKVNRDSANRNKNYLLDDFADICAGLLKENVKDKTKGISINDLGMLMMNLNGDMKTPLAAAAHVAYTVAGPISPSTHRYEHLIPRDVIKMKLTDYILNKAGLGGNTSKVEMKNLLDQFAVAIIPKAQDDIINDHYKSHMPKDWLPSDNPLKRYFNPKTFGKINLQLIDVTTGEINAKSKAFADAYKAVKDKVEANKKLSDIILKARVVVKASQGITVLDFDDTLATSNSLIRFTKPDGTKGTLNAEQYAKTYEELTELGYKWDFSEFNEVVDGKLAPLFNKAMKLQGKFGPENMFVLTARPPGAAKAIFEFLKANGLNIPIENITGLGNSTSKAKADWVAGKIEDGYNDFYFADDAIQNVEAVQNMLDQFDVKSKVQQAKVKFSETISPEFNNMLERTTGIESQKVFSEAQAKVRGAKTKYNNLIPASVQDFAGLLYNFIGKGKKGEADMAFFKKALIDPFARGINEINASRQSAANDYKNLQKAFPEVKKIMNNKVGSTEFNNDQAARVYLWNKAGFEVPGLSKRDLKTLVEHVENNPSLQAYADGVGLISKKEAGYSEPGDYWLAENITSDLLSEGATNESRGNFLAEWQQNADAMFTPENLNKVEAIYGSKFREALEDVLYRMKTGRNRPSGGGRLVNQYMNWVNNSVGAIMFLNLRSAALQTISATNYMNWSDNNPAKAAIAFGNQPQFWKDFSMIFNSDYLKQRRSGNQRGINEAELSAAVAGAENKAKAALSWLLKKGFLPTQIADSFAISMGGATLYRNRTNKYVKEGMPQEQAEKQAFLDLQETTEVNQQSARPDMISQQQASPLGRLILAFQNTPMQYARIMDKAGRDIINGRGDLKHNVSKIVYYGFAQSILFGALQSAIFASLGDDEEEDFDKKKERIINGMIDSALSGGGVGGKAIATTKNTIITFLDQRDRGFKADHAYTLLQALSFSPPIGSKLRKIYSSIQTDKFNKDVFLKRGFTLDNPIWGGVGNVIEGVTNAPLGRISNMMLQLDNVLDSRNETWKRLALGLGWNTWDLGIKDQDIEDVKTEIKEEKKVESKNKAKIKKEEKKKEKIEENKAVIEENKKKSKKDGICSAISKGGKRCKSKAINGGMCTVHEKATPNATGVKSQCKKMKDGGKQCGMQTSSKSGFCYYHD